MQIQLPAFHKARVLIVGDIMLDRYWSGATSRISPEAPVPVVHVQDIEERPGGAGNVALNITALEGHAKLLSICGADAMGDVLENKLQAAGVECLLQRMPGILTTSKIRVLSLHQQLIRLDFEEPLHTVDTQAIAQVFKQQLAQTDVVILSDYAKGCLRGIKDLIALARAANVPVFVDPKGNDFSIYRGATLITPNRREFEAVVGSCPNDEEVVRKGTELLHQHDIGALLVTRGEQGMTLIRANAPELHLPAKAREVYDVTGAGDTVIAVLAAAYADKRDLAQAATIANLAAGIVVGKLGAATVSVPELRRTIHEEHASGRGVMTEDQLFITVFDARAHNERIVMTGGCFDILHAGHVAYLEQAKSFGDRLIVAVNDDASVTRLKGAGRPINALAQRMAVLAGLNAVDWVVPFSEDTPERIVSHLLPDVWVKGGDYQVEQLPEARPVLANGGEVKILKFVEGCSTTGIVEKINQSYAVSCHNR
jgi:D-beta-D-heptose 7-phosphate kinase/D-beta-D-heptose 1-phosphate adenosyltransferase